MVQEDWAYTMRRTMQVRSELIQSMFLEWAGHRNIILPQGDCAWGVSGSLCQCWEEDGWKFEDSRNNTHYMRQVDTLLIFLFKMLSTFIWFKLKPSFQARCGEKLNQASPWGWVNPQSHATIVLSISQSDHIWSTLVKGVSYIPQQGSVSTLSWPWLTVCWSRSYPKRGRARDLLTSEWESVDFNYENGK